MQTQINPALAAAMTLERAAQVGEFQPMTPQGQPTVAAQLMQRAMPPSVPQIAQQAGLGGQIQAMQQQQAQQALMQQAMANRPPAGIEGLNPQMGNFAEGGIVGYARGELAEDDMQSFVAPEFGGGIEYRPRETEEEYRRRIAEEAEARKPKMDYAERERALEILSQMTPRMPIPEVRMTSPEVQSALANVPVAPSGRQASAESPSAGMFNAARARLGQQALEPVSPEQGIAGALALGRAQDELRRQMGLPTEMDRITKEGEEFRKLYGERGQRLAERISQLEGERGQQGIINFLLGARGMRGQGLGETMRTGAESARAYEEQTRGRIEKMQDLQLEVRGLQLEKDTALAKMKDDIANGRFKDAMANKQKAQDAQNSLLKAYAEIDLAQGKELSAEFRERLRAQQQPSEIERMLGTYQRLLKTSPQAAQEYLDTIGTLRGAGRRPAPQELRNRMLEQYADNWEKMELMEKKQLSNQGIKTYEDYVKYRDRIAGVAPTAAPSGGASSDLLKRADAIVGGR